MLLDSALRVAREAILDALAIVLPVECSGCGEPDRAVCVSCSAELAGPLLQRTLGDLDAVSAAAYDGAVAAIIVAFKDGGRTDAARTLGDALRRAVSGALAVSDSPLGRIELTPIPSSRAAFRRRGYSPVELLLRAGRLPYSRTLALTRRVRDQASLSAEQREQNLAGSLIARCDLTGRTFLLIDDVLTTGATLREGRRAIEAAGGRVLSAATIASTPLRGAPDRSPNRFRPHDPQALPSDSGRPPE